MKRKPKPVPIAAVVRPRDVQAMLRVSLTSRWRMEVDGRLPPRDFWIGDVAIGWHPETLQRAFRGPSARRRRR